MIEKDIEILQELKTTISERECQAIENVLADRERLIEENKVLKEDYQTENQYYEETIKAKIEELEKQIKEYQKETNYPRELYVNSVIIEALEELLGE